MATETTGEIKLKTGESASVHFKGLAAAGYEWNYTINENAAHVAISKDFIMPGKLNQIAAGASAVEAFTITAIKKGIVNIYFFQKRSWEKNAAPVNEKNIRIITEG